MLRQTLLSLTFAAQLVFLVVARPEGAPENEMVCIEMTPDHGENEPQTTEAPYSMIFVSEHLFTRRHNTTLEFLKITNKSIKLYSSFNEKSCKSHLNRSRSTFAVKY